MMRSLYSAISGLNGFQTKMDVIGNNIANVNTTGFKKSRVTFATALSQETKGASAPSTVTKLGGTNAVQIGLGQTYTIAQNMTEGSAETTGVNTDLKLQGPGYFVMNDGSQTLYTRAGNFGIDANGDLEDPASGAKVQGFSFGTNQSATPVWRGAGYGNINVKTRSVMPGDTMFPVPGETAIAVSALDTAPVTPSTEYTYDSLVGAENVTIHGMTSVALGTTPAAGQYSFNPITGGVTFAAGFDPTLAALNININYVAPAGGVSNNTTVVDVTAGDNTAIVDYPPAQGAPVYLGTPPVEYALSSATTLGDLEYTVAPASNSKYQITFGTNGDTPPTATVAAGPISYDFTNAPHTLSNFTIDQSGVITGVYSNGTDTISQKIAQVAVATVPNDAGMTNIGGNFYTTSNNSGMATVGASGSNGQPMIVSGELEMSNVDLSQEMTDMIIAQRGFQANSRVITIADSLLQELVDLKRQ